MERWVIEPTDRSPRVVLDREESLLLLEGRSYPEEGMDFFSPIISRFKAIQHSDTPIGKVHIRLEYYNSSTTKALADLLTAMEHAAKSGHDARVVWEFEEDDDGIQDDIDMFMDTYELDFDVRFTLFK